MGYKLSILFCVLIGLTLKSAQAQTTIKPDSFVVQIDTTHITQNLTLWQKDSCLYTQRLDSLQSEICLVYNKQVQKYIGIYTGYRKKEMCNMLEQGQYYFPIFEKALKAYNIPPLFKYLPVIESAMNVHAVSPSGATGLWQFMYTTGKHYRLAVNDYIDERKDPIKASYAAAKYLRDAYNELGDWLLTMAAYNAGTGAVKRAIAKAGGAKNYWQIQPYLSTQAQKYIPAFIAASYVMEYPHKHSLIAAKKGVIINVDTIYINQNLYLNTLNNSLNLPLHQLNLLNPSYKNGFVKANKIIPQRLIIPQLTSNNYTNLYDAINHSDFIENKDTITVIKELVEPTKPILAENYNKPVYFKKTYIVTKGDTLLTISRQFDGLSVSKLMEINNLKNTKLSIGTVLVTNVEVE